MARTFPTTASLERPVLQHSAWPVAAGAEQGIYFRALMDMGTGGVAAIEAASARLVTTEYARAHNRGLPWPIRPLRADADYQCAWGRVVREPAAYLVRARRDTRADVVAANMGVATAKIILMYAVTDLLAQPTAALESLIAAKRSGARILLDHIDMVDPPARFLEMLPADILRVAPDRMPWHWEEDRRLATLESLMGFAGNLLMDVAVEGVDKEGQRRTFKQLGVRYVQGGWRRDHHGLVPDPNRV